MAKLIYFNVTSLDGYIEDRDGGFDFSEPDEEVHTFVNDLLRGVGTYLFGRRLYEVMLVWETLDLTEQPQYMKDYAEVWRATDKIVYSKTLQDVSSDRTRLERSFDAESVRRLKAEATGDLAIGGAELAGSAYGAGLIDERRLVVAPVIVGGGKKADPEGLRANLELLDERRFEGGMVYLRYGVRS